MKNKLCTLAAIIAIFSVSNAYAVFSPFRTVTEVQVLDSGIAFTLSGSKIHAGHNTGAACTNRFVIPETFPAYDLKVSGILAAWAAKRTMSINYTADFTSNCLVEAHNYVVR